MDKDQIIQTLQESNAALTQTKCRTENLRTGNGRKCNDETVQQVLSFRFVSNGQNIGVYGKTGAGKSYFHVMKPAD